MFARSVLMCATFVAAAAGGPSLAQPRSSGAPNAVTDWAAIVQPAIHNAAAPRSAGTSQVLHTMVMLAVYDAVMAIEGGYEPYAVAIRAPRNADVKAAVATAAYFTARSRVAVSQYAYLDEQYANYLATIPDGAAKTAGVEVGDEAAEAVIALRAGDGFDHVVPYFCSSTPTPVGEFEPDSACPAKPTDPQPADAKVGQIRPFTFRDPDAVRPGGPSSLTSKRYTADFIETRDFGRANSSVRTAEQTDVAYFWSEHPYAYWSRNLLNLAVSRDLGVREAARFFAMVNTSVADAVIAGFEAKYHYTHWRPRTAIPRAEQDGNPDTPADPTWTPLLKVNHPEYPSGHGFWSTALTEALGAFFRTRQFELTLAASKVAVPQLVKTERTYASLDELMEEVANARVWGGLHWRQSIRHGERLGRSVTRHVVTRYFRPTGCGQLLEFGPCH